MTIRQIILSGTLCAATLGAGAQQLSGEVTVERDKGAVERDAAPLSLLPRLNLPQVTLPALDYSNEPVAAGVTSVAAFTEPVRRPDALGLAGVRGYVDGWLGGPMLDADLTAGYRLIGGGMTTLDARLSYQTQNYQRQDLYWHDHSIAGGLWLNHDFGRMGKLDASLDYNYNYTGSNAIDGRYYTATNVGRAMARWRRDAASYSFDAGARYVYYASNPIGLTLLPEMRSLTQHNAGLWGGASMPLGDKSRVGVRADFDMLATGDYEVADVAVESGFSRRGGSTTGTVGLTPYYSLTTGKFTLTAGPRLEFTFNGGQALHIAPEVTAGFSPSSKFAVGVKVRGGEHLNPLASLMDAGRRFLPGMAYGISRIPLAFDADIAVGPFAGVQLRLFGGWAKVDNWLMPSLPAPGAMAAFERVDMTSLHGGAELIYTHATLGSVSVRYETAPDSRIHSYYLWRDRAGHVLNVAVKATPLRRLDVKAEYELRACRSIVTSSVFDTPVIIGAPSRAGVIYSKTNIHNLSLLSIQGQWRFTDKIAARLRMENLLNHQTIGPDGAPLPGITVLVGGSYLF